MRNLSKSISNTGAKKMGAAILCGALIVSMGTGMAFATSAFAATEPSVSAKTPVTITAADIVTANEGVAKKQSTDGGKTWEAFVPVTEMECEWYTYEEYKEWVDTQKKELSQLIGTKGSFETVDENSEYIWKDFTWTQDRVDETIAMYEKTLNDIKNGVRVAKPKNIQGTDGELTTYGGSMLLGEITISGNFGADLSNGTHIGPFNTKEELHSALKNEVTAGRLTQAEADKLYSQIATGK